MPTHKLKPLPSLIFFSRWLQLPLYLGLILAQGVYVYLFLKELWHLNASVLKVKLAMAIIGISSIHLLKTFIEAGQLGLPPCQPGVPAAATSCSRASHVGVMWQTIIHCVFILSALGVAWTDKVMTGNTERRQHSA
jgi:uncharacterized membrane protein YqhA